ncbi:MAG: prolyl oligopeptidase family serine peptidase [Pseudomonadota bacterium]|nr:prolyl oligopeptidase family serine peptidase [Pseudomonadota bacterium]
MKYIFNFFLFTYFSFISLAITSDTESNAKLFGSLPDVSNVKISPNGKFVGVQQRTEETIVVKIIDLDNAQLLSVHNFGSKGQITDFFWATDKRLVFTVARENSRNTEIYNVGQLVAANIDGKRTKLIAGFGSAPDSRQGVRNRDRTNPDRPAIIVHRLPKDSNKILVSFFDNAGFNELAELDINNGKVSYVTTSPVIYPNWIFNNEGKLMGVSSSTLENNSEIFLFKPNLPQGSLSSRQCSQKQNCYVPPIREDNKRPGWVFFKDFEFPKGASIEGFTPNGKMMVTEYMDENTSGLYEYDLKENTYELIFRDSRVDITAVASSLDDGPYGIRLDNGKPEYLYLSEPNRLKNLHLKFYEAFPAQKTTITSYSKDYSRAVGIVMADVNPGTYYLMDMEKNQISPLGRYWSKTSYDSLAEMKVINFKNRYGDEIQSYFTEAVGKKNAPTIVMPHGGPWARDYWGFHPEVQFLAAEGFNVLQNNIRGSSGYGLEHTAHVYGNFANVLTDMFDSIEHLDSEGVIDKNNVCVYGGSYGGYAATQGPMMRPDLFKCAISEAGLYDINAQYSSGDIKMMRGGRKFLEDTFGDGEKAEDMSPINYAYKLKTPYMLIHGKKDVRTPYKEAEAFMKALDKNGIKYEKMIIEKETHGFSKEENRIEKMKRISAFFRKHLDT